MTMFDRIRYILKGVVPIGRLIHFTQKPSAERPFIANTLTVAKLQGILSAAEQGRCEELFDLYRDIISSDAHIQTEFAKRKICVLSEIISAQPVDKKNADDVRAAELAQELLDNIPDREYVLSGLLDSVLWPFSIAEKVFKRSYKPGLAYDLDKIILVPYKLIDLRQGHIRIYKEENGRITQDSYEATPSRYIIHKGNILTTPNYWGGPMRALLFWWLFSVMNVGWWAEFMEKFGNPFLVGKYDQNDVESRNVLSRAFAYVQRLGGLIITKDTQIEVHNALSSQNGDSYDKFLTICNREKSKLILGQTLSAEAQPTGLGSGVANSHEAVRADIKAFDCAMLARTLREQLVKPFLAFNGIKGAVPNIVIGKQDESNIESLSSLLTALTSANLRPTEEAIEIISRWVGFGVERSPQMQVSTPALSSFSASGPKIKIDAIDAADAIARRASADIAQNYGNTLAIIKKIIADSTSADDFEGRLKAFCMQWPDEDVTALIQDALAANVMNATR